MSEKLIATDLWVLQAQETIRQQQAEIDRLKGQRDRLLGDLKYLNAEIGSLTVKDTITEIEASNGK